MHTLAVLDMLSYQKWCRRRSSRSSTTQELKTSVSQLICLL